MLANLTLALRTLRKTPGLTVVAVLCLAFAIGLATAGFTVVHGAFLSPLPVPEPDRLVVVQDYHRTGRYNVAATPAQFTDRRERSTSFAGLGAWYSRNVTLSLAPGADSGPGLVRAAHVSPNALVLLGIAPRAGRHFTAEDVAPGAERVVALGHDVWRGRLGGDQAVLGRQLYVAGTAHRVIAIMPPGVRFPVREDLWIPAQTDAHAANATAESLTLFGRLAPGVSRGDAAAELAVLDRRDPQALDEAPATVPVVMPFERGFLSPEQEWAMYAFVAGLVAFLIVIAANLANLFLARNAARARELALRAALGASRRRLVGQLLSESLVLAAAGALGGVAIARAGIGVFVAQVEDLPWWADFGFTPAVLAFVVVAAAAAAAVAGLGPARRLTRLTVADTLRAGGPTMSGLSFSRPGAALLAVQLAVSVGFLSVVGVLAQGLFGFGYQQYRLPGAEVLVAQVYLGPPDEAELSRPGADRRQVWEAHVARSFDQIQRIARSLGDTPGARHVTFATHLPGNDVERARVELGSGHESGRVTTRIAEVGPDFFTTLDAPIRLGRDFTPAERAVPSTAVIVNEPFARKYFAGRSPLGASLRIVDDPDAPGPWLEVVGVVPDLGLNPGDAAQADGIYVPFQPSNFVRFAVRAAVPPAELVPALHELVLRDNPRAQVQTAASLDAQMRAAEAVFRGLGGGLLVIGGTALLLSAVSLYSLIAFGVTRRTREIGIRLALGASRRRIVAALLGRELAVVATGAVAGVVLGAALYQLVAQIPFDLRPAGPALAAAALGLILVVGAGACLVPARRAMAVDPAEALRHD